MKEIKPIILLPIELDRVILKDENGTIIEGIRSVQSYLNGIVVLTENGLYTNVKKLLKTKYLSK